MDWVSFRELRLSDVPAADAELLEIGDFANGYNAVELSGSLEKMVAIAKSPDSGSACDLWISLFFSYRAVRHFGDGVSSSIEASFRGRITQIRAALGEV